MVHFTVAWAAHQRPAACGPPDRRIKQLSRERRTGRGLEGAEGSPARRVKEMLKDPIKVIRLFSVCGSRRFSHLAVASFGFLSWGFSFSLLRIRALQKIVARWDQPWRWFIRQKIVVTLKLWLPDIFNSQFEFISPADILISNKDCCSVNID